MSITESTNSDIDVYKDRFYESHDVAFVELESIEEDEGLDGLTL